MLPATSMPAIRRPSDHADTMEAWEHFLTGGPNAVVPARNFVVASWMRSQQLGIDPGGRAAPISAAGAAMETLRLRNADLLTAAASVFSRGGDMFSGSRSIMLLTDAGGVVLDAIGDNLTLEQGQTIHLTRGGQWSEDVIGTNGIGTALATGRPAQVHAAEHFCDGIKGWTCAGCPIFEPGTGATLGVVNISGPPSTFQRSNLSLASSTARQIELLLGEQAHIERMRLLEACLDRMSVADIAGLVAIDRQGRLVHRTGRVPSLGAVGQRILGIDDTLDVAHWADRLPEGLRADWFTPVRIDGRTIGAMLVVPRPPGTLTLPRTPAPLPGHERPAAFRAIVGESPALTATIERATRLVGKQVPVLIEGETGTGKELFARAIHGEPSERRPFIVFDCGAVGKDLLSAELFGYVRGAFTGAVSEGRAGRFELANGGTLCLDEIGELPLDLQPFLLRVLEEGVVYRLGDGNARRVTVRVIAMTNRDLRVEVEAGRFRRDLFHRISITTVRPPPLRNRHGDVECLVDHFNALLSERHGVPKRQFGDEVLRLLNAYVWPGNVRELRNMVESQLLLADQPEVEPDDLLAELLMGHERDVPADPIQTATLQAAEHAAIQEALRMHRGNLAAAARVLGVSRSTLYRKIGTPAAKTS